MHIGYILRMNLPSLCIYMIVIGFSKYHQLSKVITMLHIAFKNALLFFFFFFQSIYLFLAALGLHCCVPDFCWSYSSLNEWLLTAVASLAVEHGL